MKPTTWNGCYDDTWREIITNDAFAHPAKFSRALIVRIINHGFERGYWQAGDTIGDPFGGVGTGGIECAYRGLQWIGVELEKKFVDLTRGNFELHRRRLAQLGCPRPMMVQGDSRQFDVAVAGVITSPPYSGISPEKSSSGVNIEKQWETYRAQGGGSSLEKFRDQQQRHSSGYGHSEGQISALRGPQSVDAVISSPPYSAISAGAGGLNTKPAKKKGQQAGRKAGASQTADQRYGDDPAQIAKLKDAGIEGVITSPPYAKSLRNQKDGIDWEKAKQNHEGGKHHSKGRSCRADYGKGDGQIAALGSGSIEGVVTSPPYAANEKSDYKMSSDGKTRERDLKRGFKQGHGCFRGSEGYGGTPGQIGREKKETYWQAMEQVYAACFRSIKSGGVIAIVVKDYVKAKQRVRLCDDTLRLLVHLGFEPVERIHAMLVEEYPAADLFEGADKTTRKERKSFFRRLAEKKGSPRIDYEEVIFARRE